MTQGTDGPAVTEAAIEAALHAFLTVMGPRCDDNRTPQVMLAELPAKDREDFDLAMAAALASALPSKPAQGDVERVAVALEREFPECVDEGRMGFVRRLAIAALSAQPARPDELVAEIRMRMAVAEIGDRPVLHVFDECAAKALANKEATEGNAHKEDR